MVFTRDDGRTSTPKSDGQTFRCEYLNAKQSDQHKHEL